MNLCPICGKGKLTKYFKNNLHYSICDYCGSEQANKNQINKNVKYN